MTVGEFKWWLTGLIGGAVGLYIGMRIGAHLYISWSP